MGKRYALAIGIRKSGQLPKLDGAVNDAHAFADWASAPGQDYTVRLVTDEDEAVTIDRLKSEIKPILDDDVDRLLIFYSGHGICAQTGDYWLLSNYDSDSDEAVNLLQSIRNARRRGIGQIAVFSDACRSSLNTAAMVSGRVIFPPPSRNGLSSPYDEFLSTDIGYVAQEVSNQDPAKAFGVFARCLLRALRGLEPDAAEVRAKGKVISSGALADWLNKTVPFQSGQIPGGIVQYPAITPSWRPPNDEYAQIAAVDQPKVLVEMAGGRSPGLGWLLEGMKLRPADGKSRANKARARVKRDEAGRQRQVTERTRAFQSYTGRETFQTNRSLTIIGSRITEIVVPPGIQVDVFKEAGSWHVRGGGPAHSAALRTENNIWIAATLLPQFIGTLVVGEQGADSLNYAPRNASNEQRKRILSSETIVAKWNALLSVNRGASPREFNSFADEARKVKHINPALGVLAAYAYERSGRIGEMANIAWYFVSRDQFVPFDIISLLSAYGDPTTMIRAQGPVPDTISVAGGYPMLTRGWAMLDAENGARPELVSLRAGLMDSVWTAFNAEAGSRFAALIQKGEI
nr:caspase family protein [uncultured Rhodopila sp.]